ncbi:MAG: ATP-binding protein [Candidatus Tectimicrobiota bacterium]
MPASHVNRPRATLAARLDLIGSLMGSLALLLGSMAFLGGYVPGATVTSLWPTMMRLYSPVALGFLLCGLGILALNRGWRRLGIVSSTIAAGIGLLTLYAYVFAVHLEWEPLVLGTLTSGRAGFSGDMAPQTALSFLLTGTALVVLCLPICHGLTLLIPGLLGFMVCGFGVVACVESLLGAPGSAGEQPFAEIAAQAALVCLLLGSGVIAATWRRYEEAAPGVSPWAPALVGMGVTVVTLGLWQALLSREHSLIDHTVALAATSVQDTIIEQIVSRLRALERMAQRWQTTGRFSQAFWEQDVALVRRHDPYLRNIAWVDPSFEFLWLAPLSAAETQHEQRLGLQSRQHHLFERARNTEEIQVVRVGEPDQAQQELWLAMPLFRGEAFWGCLVGIVNLSPLLTQIVDNIAEDFALTILEENTLVYAHHAEAARYKESLGRNLVIRFPGLTWHVGLWPTATVLTNQFSALPFAGLLVGLLTAILLVSLTYYAQTAQLRATQLSLTNKALRESYHFLQSTLDALSASLVIIEEQGTIVAVNAAWSHYVTAHGLPASAHGVGTNYLEFYQALGTSEGCVTRAIGAGMRAVIGHEMSTFSYEYACHSSAEPRWFLLRVTRFDGKGGVRVVVAHEDISEIKRAEEILRQQQEALVQSEKLATMSGLLAGVAHELNNPLAVIMVQSDVLREQTTESDLIDLATDINQSAVRCERIVRNFLTLARPTTSERTQVQLNEVITEVLQLLSYTLQLDEVTVFRHLADDLPVLWGDPHQLQQVVVNLLTNAQQAVHETAPPHQITVTTRYETTPPQVCLDVADSGPGVPLELQHRIFDPFFTTKPSGIGTGLGLPLCQSVVAGHGGHLHVTSQTGQGACFTMELPLGEAGPPITPGPLAAAPSITGKTFLVVDDEVGTTKALVRLFHRDGHTVDTASNGHAALTRLQARDYDLILCDLRMPQLDGPGLYRLIAQAQPHLLPRFIFLTGDTLSPEAKNFLEDSHAPYLVKPFRAAAVRQLVQYTLQGFEMT